MRKSVNRTFKKSFKRARILWGLWLAAMIALLIFTENYAVQILLALSLILPAAGIGFAALGAENLSAEIKAQPSQLKNRPFEYGIKVKNSGRWACVKGKAVLKIENVLTGEITLREICFSVEGRKTAEIKEKQEFDHCGKLRLTVEDLQYGDFIGAYAKSSKIGDVKTNGLIMPETYPIEINMAAGGQTDMNSDEYSMLKPGFDPSETFAIREYRYGDKIKNIHWKLSEKLGELSVRELGLPINNSVLLLLDTSYDKETGSPDAGTLDAGTLDAGTLDAVGETFISVARRLCDEQIPYRMSWYDRETGRTEAREVLNEEDLTVAMAGALSASFAEDTVSALEHFAEDKGPLEYAHVIVVGVREEKRIESEICEGMVTNLVCGCEESSQRHSAAGNQVVYFTPQTMQEDLFYIEV